MEGGFGKSRGVVCWAKREIEVGVLACFGGLWSACEV